ncbi:MAG: hypothetical protein JW818_11345 [Pirellulales bacterium]|nr:hypothetical protein [Pirellulales bacterium]
MFCSVDKSWRIPSKCDQARRVRASDERNLPDEKRNTQEAVRLLALQQSEAGV